MTHKQIRRFQESGVIGDDKSILRLREQYIKILTERMRDDGYVRVLDLDPAWSIQYDSEKERYSFLLTIHGVYVGKQRAQKIDGVSNLREIPV